MIAGTRAVADDDRIDEDRRREPDAELLDDPLPAEDERAEDDDHDRGRPR